MKLIALKDLPNRVKEGEAFEETEGRGQVLITLNLAREAEPITKRTYRRRDLRAED